MDFEGREFRRWLMDIRALALGKIERITVAQEMYQLGTSLVVQ